MNKEDKLGALWKRQNEKGEEYYSGVLENADGTKTKIVIFRNGYKNTDKQPDYMILKSRAKQDTFEFSNTNSTDDDFDDLPF